jgi:acetyl esterase
VSEAIFEEPVRQWLEFWRDWGASMGPFDPTKLPQARADLSAQLRDRTVADGVTVTDIEVDGVPVRLYRPALDGRLPLHVFYHGGGFILGSALSGECDGFLSRRAAEARCVVASVEYSLAPEHPFPAGIEDSYAALAGLARRAGELGLTEVISVGGRSSGGNFAAVVALMAKAHSGPRLALQLLEVAGTDLTKSSAAWRTPGPGADTTRESELAMVDLYLPTPADRVHPYASPLFAPDLTGVAPAYVMNAEFDPRRDECEAYVTRLRDAGVEAVARTMLGHIHGSVTIIGWPPADAWNEHANNVLAEAHAAAAAGRAVTFGEAAPMSGS